MLGNYSLMERSTQHAMEINPNGNEAETAYLPDVAHVILLFVEKLIEKLRTAKICFERNPGKKGAAMAIKEWEKFRTSDDTEFDILLDGPSGHGQNGKPVGCKPFFDKLGMSESDFEILETHVEAFNGYLRGQNDNEERDRVSNIVDKLTELVCKLSWAAKKPEHYYTAVVAVANGSLAFASGQDEEEESNTNRFRRKPKSLPFMGSRTKDRPNAPLSTCKHEPCRHKGTSSLSLDHTSDGRVRHGYYCDGSTPKWECQLNLDLLTPGPLMQELAKECRSVVLASGSLAPLPSLCAELNLFPAESSNTPVKSSKSDGIDSLPAIERRLQVQPRYERTSHYYQPYYLTHPNARPLEAGMCRCGLRTAKQFTNFVMFFQIMLSIYANSSLRCQLATFQMDQVGPPFVTVARSSYHQFLLRFARTLNYQSCVCARRTIGRCGCGLGTAKQFTNFRMSKPATSTVRKVSCPSLETALSRSLRVYPRAACLCFFLAILSCASARERGIQMHSSVVIDEISGGKTTNENRFGTDLSP